MPATVFSRCERRIAEFAGHACGEYNQAGDQLRSYGKSYGAGLVVVSK